MPDTVTGDAVPSTATAPREGVVAVEEQLINFVGTIRANARAAAISIDPSLAPFGLKLLRLLRKEGPTHSSAAADLLLVDRSVISRQVKQLQELGLIQCS
ncbi:MAG TPA: helix-turn-helix domain-containing protein, partial [Glaciihabitans sp.]|nr:helix-turn-helix domain-containing protein [Glaciihabitans sp.]